MSIQPDEWLEGTWVPIEIASTSDATITSTITDPTTGLPFDLTGCTVKLRIKHGRYDSDGAIIAEYTATVAAPLTGVATFSIPQAQLPLPGAIWYRLDVLAGSSVRTVNFGPFIIQSA